MTREAPLIPESLYGRRLKDIEPRLFVPHGLLSLADSSKIEVVKVEDWIGSYDNGYEPALNILVVERDAMEPSDTQEHDDSHWSKYIDKKRRKLALERRLISLSDKVLISVIAHDLWRRDGVDLKSYAQIAQLRGRGLGRSFFENWNRVLRATGNYLYYYGEHTADNIGFFLKIGAYKLADIKHEWLSGAASLVPPRLQRQGLSTIRFLDQELEKSCVKPDCLRNNE